MDIRLGVSSKQRGERRGRFGALRITQLPERTVGTDRVPVMYMLWALYYLKYWLESLHSIKSI